MAEVDVPQSILQREAQALDTFLKTTTEHPESFAAPSKQLSQQALKLTKTLYDHAKVEEEDTIGRVGDLGELLIEGFDSEQVWQELELQNEPLYEHLNDLTAALLEDGEDVDLEADFLGDAESDEVSGEESFESGEESAESGQVSDGNESEESMSDDDEEAAQQAKAMREAIRAKGPGEEKGKRAKRGPLDDQFFNFDEMARFADEGEGGGGLLTNTGDSDEEDIYSLMYGDGADDDESDDEPKSKQKKRSRQDMADLDPEERRLEQVLNKTRKTLQVDDDDDDDDEGLFDSDGSDVGAEDAYFEDFFAEPTAKRRRGPESDESEISGEEDEEAMDEDPFSEEGSDMMNVDADDKEEDEEDSEEDDEDGAGLSTHQKEQRDREKMIRKMEREMMSDGRRDDATMTSTGNLGVSSFEAHQRHLLKKTEKMEEELVGKKRWTLGGEVKAAQRGTNTLLAEDLDFEMATKAAPIISAEVTKSLEDTIKRRILDHVFDDPIRKLDKPDRGDYRARAPDLDQEKSKKSLSQIMEDEYTAQTQPGAAKDAEKDKMTEQQKECLLLFKSVCMRMDALANAHFTPLKVKEELDVVPLKDAAAIHLEDVTPATVSNATLLAPEELYKTSSRGATRGESEWTTEEKRALRRERKKQHAKSVAEQESEKRREAILHPDKKKSTTVAEALQIIAKGPNTTISKNSDRTHYTSSTAFQKITEAAASSSSSSAPSKR
jgi:U3 small nucleolar RNA-associated protein MPP10